MPHQSWTIGKKAERILEATEMKMMWRIRRVTLKDRGKSENIRKELGVDDINKKEKKIRMRWYGHYDENEGSTPAEESHEI